MTEQEISGNVIKFIIAFVVIVIIAGLLFFGPGKQLLAGIKANLPEAIELELQNKFDAMSNNIENCAYVSDDNCLCEIFPSWPGTFATNSKLKISFSENKTQITLTHPSKTKPLKNSSFNNLLFSAKEIETMQNIPFMSAKEISWEKEPPLFVQENIKKQNIVSRYIYKEKNTFYLLISNKKESEIQSKLNEMKLCKA